jgi:hypothetical protein
MVGLTVAAETTDRAPAVGKLESRLPVTRLVPSPDRTSSTMAAPEFKPGTTMEIRPQSPVKKHAVPSGIQRDETSCYPQSSVRWTGSVLNSSITDQSMIRAVEYEVGWAKFDVSAVPDGDAVFSVTLWVYVNDTYWPWWMITPVTADPVTAGAQDLFDDIMYEYNYGGEYNDNGESSTFAPGWHSYVLGGTANADLMAALSQDWFAVGMLDYDFSPDFYLIMDGWDQSNPPYIVVEHGSGYNDLACVCIQTDPSDGVLHEVGDDIYIGAWYENKGTSTISASEEVAIKVMCRDDICMTCTETLGVDLGPGECVDVWCESPYYFDEDCSHHVIVAYHNMADGVPENDTLVKSLEVPGIAVDELLYDDGAMANAYYFYSDTNVMATMFTPDIYPFTLSYVGVYVLSEGDAYWPWPDATHDQFRIGIWMEDPGNPGYPMEPSCMQFLPGWHAGWGDSTLYKDGDCCMWGDAEPPSWVYAVPQCGDYFGNSGPIVVEDGSFWVGMTNIGYEEYHCASPGQEGIGLDAALNYPNNQWVRLDGVWQLQPYYDGDHLIRAWGYSNLLDHDVGVQYVMSPVGGITPGSQDVVAKIKNYGANEETFDARFFIRDDGGGIVYDQTHSITLASGASEEHDFGTFDADPDEYFTDSCYTMLAGDENASNDTATAECWTSMGPGDIVFLCDAGDLTADNHLLGVEYVDGYFFVSGGNSGADPNKIYVIDTSCTLLCTMDQPAHSTDWGWRDLSHDGVSGYPYVDTLYGSVNSNVDKFSVDVDACALSYYSGFPGPYYPNRALAYDGYDPDTGYFYSANWGVNFVKFSKQNPNIGNCYNDLSAYGAAWDNDTLWIAAQELNSWGQPNMLFAMYWPTCTVVDQMEFDNPSGWTAQTAGGADFDYYNGMAVLFELVQGDPTDYIIGLYRHPAPAMDVDSAWLSLDESGYPKFEEIEIFEDTLGTPDTTFTMHFMFQNASDSGHAFMFPVGWPDYYFDLLDMEIDTTMFPDAGIYWNLFELDTIHNDMEMLMFYGWTAVYDYGVAPGLHHMGEATITSDVGTARDSVSETGAIDTVNFPPAGHLIYSHGPSAEDYWPEWLPVTVTYWYDVEELVSTPVPLTNFLAPTRPNPFRATTEITFGLKVQSDVDVAVYDVSGRRIVTLDRSRKDAGTYTITWNGKDSFNRKVSSGVYVLRMQAGDYESTRKLLID